MVARLLAVALAATLLAAAGAGTAAGRPGCGHSVAPPGHSEGDEYSEFIPGPCGRQNPGGGGGGSHDAVSSDTLSQLQSLGADGQGAAALAQATSPGGGKRDAAGSGGSDGGITATSSGGGSALSGLLDGLTGDSGDGMGALLPVLLLATLGAGLAFAVVVRRRAS